MLSTALPLLVVIEEVGSCDELSCAKTPLSHKRKGLVTIEQFLGCANPAILMFERKQC